MSRWSSHPAWLCRYQEDHKASHECIVEIKSRSEVPPRDFDHAMCIVQMIVERHRRREPRTAVQAERVTVGELGLALLFVEAWMRSIIAIGGDEGMHIYLSISGTSVRARSCTLLRLLQRPSAFVGRTSRGCCWTRSPGLEGTWDMFGTCYR